MSILGCSYFVVIGVSVSEPHTGALAGGFSICIYIYMYVRYVCDSVYLYDLLLYLSGALPQVWARDQLLR